MATLEGGLRDRMMLQSVVNDVVANLTTRGWFINTGKEYLPFSVVDEFPDDKDEVALNTIAFSMGDTASNAAEMGSKSELLHTSIFIDFFAENDGLGRHVVGDIAAHVNDVGQFTVYDYRQVTPSAEFVVLIAADSLERTKPIRAVNAWQKHWHSVAFVVMEERFI
jgi:hypothetical protein